MFTEQIMHVLATHIYWTKTIINKIKIKNIKDTTTNRLHEYFSKQPHQIDLDMSYAHSQCIQRCVNTIHYTYIVQCWDTQH